MSWADTGILLATVALCAAAVVCAVVWLGDWAHRRRRKSGAPSGESRTAPLDVR